MAVGLVFIAGCAVDEGYEARQTAKLLGVQVNPFPPPQGLKQFDNLSADAPVFEFELSPSTVAGPEPRVWYQPRKTVAATAPDGTVYTAYCGYEEPEIIEPGHGFVSTLDNRRQPYGTMYFAAEYYPQDVFVGTTHAGKLKPTLFFRDVGSHDTAPHSLAVDGAGRCHLIVADVNIYQENRLDLYWVVGDPVTKKWTRADLVDSRGFTSWSSPKVVAAKDVLHLLWSWVDAGNDGHTADSGLFYVNRSADQVGHKVRVIPGEVYSWDVAVDSASGRLLLAATRRDGVYVSLRDGDRWTRPAKLPPAEASNPDVAVAATGDGAFLVNVSSGKGTWLLRPK